MTYFLQRGTSLSTLPAWSVLESNIVGRAGTTAYPDITATNLALPHFYCVGAQ